MERHAGVHDITPQRIKIKPYDSGLQKKPPRSFALSSSRDPPRFMQTKEIVIKHHAIKLHRFVVRFAISWRTVHVAEKIQVLGRWSLDILVRSFFAKVSFGIVQRDGLFVACRANCPRYYFI